MLTGMSTLHAQTLVCNENCERNAVQAYLNSLTSHDASAVPLAANVQRIENGAVTAVSADQLRQDLNHSIKYDVIIDLRDETLIGTAGNYVAIYSLDVGKIGNGQIATSRIFERFQIKNGLITQIEAGIVILPGKYAAPTWPTN